jgi:exonuclease SbcC
MPSRAGADGLGAFSYYDHLCLPQNEKELVWAHGGQRYRSQQVFWLQGSRRRSEAYLARWDGNAWQPVSLPDGTVSDGKVETYARCVQALLGSPETFFTSAFSPQGRRQLSAYRNAEIKGLLADLLGLERLRRLGSAAAQTGALLRAGLATTRQELASLDAQAQHLVQRARALGDAEPRVSAARLAHEAALNTWQQHCAQVARLLAQQEQLRAFEGQRAALHERRQLAEAAAIDGLRAVDDREQCERERLGSLRAQVAERATAWRSRRQVLEGRRAALLRSLESASEVTRAIRLLPVAQRMAERCLEHLALAEASLRRASILEADVASLRERIAALEREAGQGALRVADLTRRFALTDAVPCRGMALQGTCSLLADARTAQALIPQAGASLERLAVQRDDLRMQLRAAEAQQAGLAGPADAGARLVAAGERSRRVHARLQQLAASAAQQPHLELAQQTLLQVDAELAAVGAGAPAEHEGETLERRRIDEALATVARDRAGVCHRRDGELRQVAEVLAALPTAFDAPSLHTAESAVATARATLDAAEQAMRASMADAQSLAELRVQRADVEQQRAGVAGRVSRCEQELGLWGVLAKCLSNDGIVALAIDEAGPALAGLANELLLACYGPRFTVSIATLVATAKAEAREGFDIVVHDGDTGQSKSVGWMSGGERIWINECLVRAIALYLAQHSGRSYETLFSDEADGALDMTRKRMFVAMKREVLRLGGYAQEIFVSQTPELAAMADAVIDLDKHQALLSARP